MLKNQLYQIFRLFFSSAQKSTYVKPDSIVKLSSQGLLFDPSTNSPSQQGDPEIQFFKNVNLWHRYSVASHGDVVIRNTFIDADRIPRHFDENLLKHFPCKKIDGYITSIDYVFSGRNYFHYLVDCLPRLWCLRHPSLRRLNVKLCIPKKYSSDLMRIVRHIAPEVQINIIPEYYRIFCENYIHLPYLSKDRVEFSQNDTQTSAGFIPNEYLQFFRKEIPDIFNAKTKTASKLIYISRKDANQRRVINEKELINALRKIFGFELFVPGRMSITEQIELFRSAKIIVGLHGAALTNLLFCYPSQKSALLEIFPSTNNVHHYFRLHAEKILGMEYRQMILDRQHISSDIEVSISKVVLLLKEMIGIINPPT